MQERYYTKYAAAAVLGNLIRTKRESLIDGEIFSKSLDELSDKEIEYIFDIAKENDIKLYHFKKSDRHLPRVHKTISFLKGISFDTLLDVGSGRGVFLLPFMEEFPYVKVTSLDILDKRVNMLTDICRGGVETLSVIKADICNANLPENSADVVTLLEVLEHIPNVRAAIRAAVRVARRYVVVTVPSKEDDNPEHIHLLTKSILTEYFADAGVYKLSFDGVPGHLFLIAKVEK